MFIGITGGAGFIGSRLANHLVGAGHRVAILDNLHPQVHVSGRLPGDLADDVAVFVGSVTDADAWDAWFRRDGLPDVIVHLAAETGTGQSLTAASRHADVNVGGTSRLLDALSRHEHRPAQLIVASSRAVYGEGRWLDRDGSAHDAPQRSGDQLREQIWNPIGPNGPLAEPLPHAAADVAPRPTNVYAVTKLAQEQMMAAWCGSFDVPLSVLRLQNVYGPGQAVGNPYTGVLTFFAAELARGQVLDVYEDGEIVRDFVFVDDVVRALAAAIDRPPSGSRHVDIGSGVRSSLFDIASAMSDVAGVAPPKISGRFRHGDVRAAFADITAAQQQLAWSPEVAGQDGLSRLVQAVAAEVAV